MDFPAATAAFESWLRTVTAVHGPDLDHKHAVMAEPFPFFRGTYYRWAQLWPEACADLAAAPRVLAVGDLHVENFGTWRDADGRLCWGVNDFDEADELPYTHDLVRLAASVLVARASADLGVKPARACDVLLDRYRATLGAGGRPFVLEERYPHLRQLAMAADRDPKPFWKKMQKLLADDPAEVPEAARVALVRDLPPDLSPPPEFRFRPKVGVGSLGKPRYVALAEWAGGWVAREAKAVTPPSTAWTTGTDRPSRVTAAVSNAKRSPDPFYRVESGWVVRRLAPRCSRIELDQLAGADDLERLFRGMGAEAANVHLGTPAAAAILADLDARPAGWLLAAARTMVAAITADWKAWRAIASARGRGHPGRL
jgi:hypothetical protein